MTRSHFMVERHAPRAASLALPDIVDHGHEWPLGPERSVRRLSRSLNDVDGRRDVGAARRRRSRAFVAPRKELRLVTEGLNQWCDCSICARIVLRLALAVASG